MKKIRLKKFFKPRALALALFLLLLPFLFVHPALAAVSDWPKEIVGGIIGVLIQGVTSILVLLVGVLMKVASYSDFINAQAVLKGWIIVRDVCNMFFVVIMLIIAFATILGKEEYGAKKMLPKLVLAAILINFSKMICGLMIDAASVIMLTFVSAFSAIGAANILDVMGISDVMKLSSGADVSFSAVVVSYIFGLIYVLIATVVVASMLAMLVMRVVMIWILTVLSPLAFFLQAVPGKGQQYASQWWTQWTQNLIVGPILAFFLWLSFAALGASSPNPNPISGSAVSDADVSAVSGGGLSTEAGTTAGFAKFVIAIGMLLGGMKIAMEAGGETGKILGAGMSKINKGKAMVLGAGAAVGGYALGKTTKAVGRGIGYSVLTGISKTSGTDLTTGKPKGNLQNFALQWRNDLQDAQRKKKTEQREKFLKKIGITSEAGQYGQAILNSDKMQTTGRIASGSKTGALSGAAIGSFVPVAGTIGGAALGALAGGAVGWLSKKRYNRAKTEKEAYEKEQKNDDLKTIGQAQGKERSAMTNEEKAAADRLRDYYHNSKLVANRESLQEATGGTEAFPETLGALKKMTADKKRANDWVKAVGNDKAYLSNAKEGAIYQTDGVSKTWKGRLDSLNKNTPEAQAVIGNMVAEMSGGKVNDAKLVELSKLLAGYKKGGATLNPATLGRLSDALANKGEGPDKYAAEALTQYRNLNADMELHPGSGALHLDAFARNSAKAALDRDPAKDIVGVSFDKLNARAKELNLGGSLQLDTKAGANQKIVGGQTAALAATMSSLIGDEIKTAQTRGATADELNRLKTAKQRFDNNDLSSLSLKNTDVSYKGATDTERRQAEYNTVQHEQMHQAGAQNEELVSDSADMLQQAKLIGRIPGTEQRYDQAIGRLIATMEKNQAGADDIRNAVAKQVDGWTPSNASRVLETETGKRDSESGAVPTAGADNTAMVETLKRLDSTLDHLQNPSKGLAGSNPAANQLTKMSSDDRNFFIRSFDRLKKTADKNEEALVHHIDKGKEISPLVSRAGNEELKL